MEAVVETVIDEEVKGSVLFEDSTLCVRLSSHPQAFQDVLAKHFRKVIELTDNFSRIDSYLPNEGDFVSVSHIGCVRSIVCSY